jgi:hypothetical protein
VVVKCWRVSACSRIAARGGGIICLEGVHSVSYSITVLQLYSCRNVFEIRCFAVLSAKLWLQMQTVTAIALCTARLSRSVLTSGMTSYELVV